MKEAATCPNCQSSGLMVVNKRENADGSVYRRRACRECGQRYSFAAGTFYVEGVEVTLETLGTSRHQSRLRLERMWQRVRSALV